MDTTTSKTSLSLNPSMLQFAIPERLELSTTDRFYYMQELTYNGEELCLESDWFEGEGPRFAMGSKVEMMFRCSGIMKESLDIVQSEAIRQLTVPDEYNIPKENAAGIFKCIPKCPFLFAKLGRGAQFFDQNCNPIAREMLGYGQYRVIIHVKGMYIGPHGESTIRASVQLKVKQIQYVPVFRPCLFSSTSKGFTPPGPPSVCDENKMVPSTLKKKKPKKPKNPRQNAVLEPDFIVDLDG